MTLQWRHNGLDGVSNHQPHHCLLSRLFGRISKKTSKLRVTGLCAGNSPGTGEFPAQMAYNGENVSIWWRHHDMAGSTFRSFGFLWADPGPTHKGPAMWNSGVSLLSGWGVEQTARLPVILCALTLMSCHCNEIREWNACWILNQFGKFTGFIIISCGCMSDLPLIVWVLLRSASSRDSYGTPSISATEEGENTK